MSGDAFLLAIDVGNTNISLGLFDAARKLHADWRLETRTGRTADEYVAILSELFRLGGIDVGTVKAAAISSVVPPISRARQTPCFPVAVTDSIAPA
jgi:type III pantothenate kinase